MQTTPMTSHQSTMQICKFGSSCVSLPGKIVQYQFGSLLPAVTYMRCIALPVQSFYPVFLGRGNTAAAHSFHLDPEAMKNAPWYREKNVRDTGFYTHGFEPSCLRFSALSSVWNMKEQLQFFMGARRYVCAARQFCESPHLSHGAGI